MSRSRKSRATARQPLLSPAAAVRSCSSCYGPVDVQGTLLVCQTPGCPAHGRLLTAKHRKLRGLVGT